MCLFCPMILEGYSQERYDGRNWKQTDQISLSQITQQKKTE